MRTQDEGVWFWVAVVFFVIWYAAFVGSAAGAALTTVLG